MLCRFFMCQFSSSLKRSAHAVVVEAHAGDVVNLHKLRAIITILFLERFSVVSSDGLIYSAFFCSISHSYVPGKLTAVIRKFPSSNPIAFKDTYFPLHRAH